MWPTVFTIPWLNLPVRGYGLMLMIGFLGGTWWAARRAVRVKCDPDFVINLGFVALIFSVIGARLFYVIHYWDKHFAGRGIKAVIDISAGGMEFYGGFIGGFLAILVYMLMKKVSFRLYLDILAPSLMFGMGMARIGCYLNGCCWGAPCAPNIPWSVRFPYASPVAYRQWEDRLISYPAELIVIYSNGVPSLISRDDLTLTPEQRRGPERAYRNAEEALAQAKTNNSDSKTLAKLTKARDEAKQKWKDNAGKMMVRARQEYLYGLTPSELEALAHSSASRTHTVHPAQLYASMNGILLAIMLNALFYRRKRHGIVMAVLFLLYPVMRVIEEAIRIDNPHDTAGMTISQFISLLIFLSAVAVLIALYRMPLRSPKAVPFVPPPPTPRDGNKKTKT